MMPDETNILFSILIAEKQMVFRMKLKDILLRECERQPDYQFKIDWVSNREELVAYNKLDINMVFINLSLIEEDFESIENLTDFNSETFFVLLISDEGGVHIKKATQVFNRYQHYFFDEHFLIDNYSSSIMQLFCRDLIKKMISKRFNN